MRGCNKGPSWREWWQTPMGPLGAVVSAATARATRMGSLLLRPSTLLRPAHPPPWLCSTRTSRVRKTLSLLRTYCASTAANCLFYARTRSWENERQGANTGASTLHQSRRTWWRLCRARQLSAKARAWVVVWPRRKIGAPEAPEDPWQTTPPPLSKMGAKGRRCCSSQVATLYRLRRRWRTWSGFIGKARRPASTAVTKPLRASPRAPSHWSKNESH